MITVADAEATAARWARREAERSGRAVEPMMHEFDLGFIVWTRTANSSEMPEPGTGSKTVLDRETASLTYYPALSIHEVEGLYRDLVASRPRRPTTVDGVAELRRLNAGPVTPTVAAHLTLVGDGRLRRAFDASSDGALNHHRLVRDWLGTRKGLAPGVERHAEVIVVSDVLHEAGPDIGVDDARQVLLGARFEAYHVREAGDPLGGQPALRCPDCLALHLQLGLLVAGEPNG